MGRGRGGGWGGRGRGGEEGKERKGRDETGKGKGDRGNGRDGTGQWDGTGGKGSKSEWRKGMEREERGYSPPPRKKLHFLAPSLLRPQFWPRRQCGRALIAYSAELA